PDIPFLEMQIDSTSVDLGHLSTSSTATGSANFHVRAYLDSGFTVLTMSNPPSIPAGYSLANMSSQGTAVTGTEQFGMNLVANTSPASCGGNPSPQPDSTFAFGQAAPGYDTANQYKYVKGDVIANTISGKKGWGRTNFTICYIANIKPLTPAGVYTMVHDLVAVPTY
ncbi:MAG TPA: hypothetical protein VFB03_01925, partial [Candidatus Saccharimonadales bacterium]|nr:hypothetical protein [Candidatus Saccharimonadales bacterium]